MKRIVLLILVFMTVVSLSACKPANTGAAPTVPADSQPTSEPTAPSEPTMPPHPLEGIDEHWGEYGGKVFFFEDDFDREDVLARYLTIYPDGTFFCKQSMLSANFGDMGTWTLEGNILTLYCTYTIYKEGVEDGFQECSSQLLYDDGALTLIKGENDILTMAQHEDGKQYIFKAVINKDPETT